jgi:hypothetical protein
MREDKCTDTKKKLELQTGQWEDNAPTHNPDFFLSLPTSVPSSSISKTVKVGCKLLSNAGTFLPYTWHCIKEDSNFHFLLG